MTWHKATRTIGDRYRPGEFHVEDNDGFDWQVTVTESTKTPGLLVCQKPAVCMNRGFAASLETEQDIFDAVRNVLAEESWGNKAAD